MGLMRPLAKTLLLLVDRVAVVPVGLVVGVEEQAPVVALVLHWGPQVEQLPHFLRRTMMTGDLQVRRDRAVFRPRAGLQAGQ